MSERPFLRTFGAATVALALLFTVVGADPAAALSPFGALLFWLVHVGTGLLFAIAIAAALNRWPRAAGWAPAVRLLVAGIGGALLFTPFSVALESWFPDQTTAGGDDLLDGWETAGGVAALAAEFLHVAPSYILAWLLVNLASRLGALGVAGANPRARETAPGAAPADAGTSVDAPAPAGTHVPSTAPAAVATPAPDATPSGAESPSTTHGDLAGGLLASLPPLIGRDVVHVAADLHYLQVHTTRGRAMLLGSLASVESELEGLGTRVHRSHWVAHAHVRRIARTAAGWHCELSGGQRVPISRRRVQLVRSRLGTDFVVEGNTG